MEFFRGFSPPGGGEQGGILKNWENNPWEITQRTPVPILIEIEQ